MKTYLINISISLNLVGDSRESQTKWWYSVLIASPFCFNSATADLEFQHKATRFTFFLTLHTRLERKDKKIDAPGESPYNVIGIQESFPLCIPFHCLKY